MCKFLVFYNWLHSALDIEPASGVADTDTEAIKIQI